MHINSLKNSTEYFSGSHVALPFQNILHLSFCQWYAVTVPARVLRPPAVLMALPSLLGGLQPHTQLARPWARETPSSSDPGPSHVPDCIVGGSVCSSVLPMPVPSHALHWSKPWSADRFFSLTLTLPSNHWLPALGLGLICWLVLLAKPQTCLSPWSVLVIWTFCWSWLPPLALLGLPCSGTVGLVRPVPWQLHHCARLPTPCAAARPVAPSQLLLARRRFRLHAEFIAESPASFKCF